MKNINNNEKFKIVSRVYSKNLNTVTFVIFNVETGEFKKEVINNEIAKAEANTSAEQKSGDAILESMKKEIGDIYKNLLSSIKQ